MNQQKQWHRKAAKAYIASVHGNVAAASEANVDAIAQAIADNDPGIEGMTAEEKWTLIRELRGETIWGPWEQSGGVHVWAREPSEGGCYVSRIVVMEAPYDRFLHAASGKRFPTRDAAMTHVDTILSARPNTYLCGQIYSDDQATPIRQAKSKRTAALSREREDWKETG